MNSSLANKHIALLEARMSSELANLVTRHGGTAHSFPALREATVEAGAEVAALLDAFARNEIGFIVFQTGVGVAALLTEADKLGRQAELLAALAKVTKICRGPKPTAVLARNGLKPEINASEPFTTTDLLSAMEPLVLNGATIALLHYGERNAELTAWLETRGARLNELTMYEWQLPEDIAPLHDLIARLPRGEFDAVAFTSQIQARHLFQIAEASGQARALRRALNIKTVTASIGPTCTAALQALGVEPCVEPENPKMGHLVVALGHYFAAAN
jgi:uroporphyrinogen-III synthase